MIEPHLYAVFGSPIAHSRSPEIHRAFAQQTEEDLVYTKQEVSAEQFSQACREFFEFGGSGLNITLPLKELAHDFASERSEAAQTAGAVNTLKREDDGSIFGDNTDGRGLLQDLTANLGWNPAGRRILVLGAGGAVRGILGPLLSARPEALWIANRTAAKAKVLAEHFAGNVPVYGCGLDEIPGDPFDLVINGTSLSLQAQRPPLGPEQLKQETACYDMAYGDEPTAFLQWVAAQGVAHRADGLGMLVEQAAESFLLWRGIRPETGPVIQQLRQ